LLNDKLFGSVTKKVVPSSGMDSTSIVSLCKESMRFVKVSPSPKPGFCNAEDARKNGWKIFWISASLITSPLFNTLTIILCLLKDTVTKALLLSEYLQH